MDYSTIRAFIFDGTKAVNLKKGGWHDFPFFINKKTRVYSSFSE